MHLADARAYNVPPPPSPPPSPPSPRATDAAALEPVVRPCCCTTRGAMVFFATSARRAGVGRLYSIPPPPPLRAPPPPLSTIWFGGGGAPASHPAPATAGGHEAAAPTIMPSVTTVLGVLEKGALTPWALRVAMDSVRTQCAVAATAAPTAAAAATTARPSSAASGGDGHEESVAVEGAGSATPDVELAAVEDAEELPAPRADVLVEAQEESTVHAGSEPARVQTIGAGRGEKDWSVTLTAQQVDRICVTAAGAPNVVKDKAAGFGTRAHAAIDAIVRGEAVDDAMLDEDVRPVVAGFRRWAADCGMQLCPMGDTVVYSRTYRYAGAADCFGVRPGSGKLTVIDFKTSNSIHSSYALQLAAYASAVKEMIAAGELLWDGVSLRQPAFTRSGTDAPGLGHVVARVSDADEVSHAASTPGLALPAREHDGGANLVQVAASCERKMSAAPQHDDAHDAVQPVHMELPMYDVTGLGLGLGGMPLLPSLLDGAAGRAERGSAQLHTPLPPSPSTYVATRFANASQSAAAAAAPGSGTRVSTSRSAAPPRAAAAYRMSKSRQAVAAATAPGVPHSAVGTNPIVDETLVGAAMAAAAAAAGRRGVFMPATASRAGGDAVEVDAMVVRFDKKTGDFEVNYVADVAAAFDAFKAALLLWHAMRTNLLKSTPPPPPLA